MAISDQKLIAAFTKVHEIKEQMEERIGNLEGAPARAQLEEQWNSGREYLRNRGYNAQRVAEVEDFMQKRGILSHHDAVRLYPFQPSAFEVMTARMEPDEIEAMKRQDFETMTNLAISRALGR